MVHYNPPLLATHLCSAWRAMDYLCPPFLGDEHGRCSADGTTAYMIQNTHFHIENSQYFLHTQGAISIFTFLFMHTCADICFHIYVYTWERLANWKINNEWERDSRRIMVPVLPFTKRLRRAINTGVCSNGYVQNKKWGIYDSIIIKIFKATAKITHNGYGQNGWKFAFTAPIKHYGRMRVISTLGGEGKGRCRG